jgi:hypothetical protein
MHNEKPTVDKEKWKRDNLWHAFVFFISFVVCVASVKYPESLSNYASSGLWRNVETKEEKW